MNEPVLGEELNDWADQFPEDEGHVLHKSFGSITAGETHADSTTQLPVRHLFPDAGVQEPGAVVLHRP